MNTDVIFLDILFKPNHLNNFRQPARSWLNKATSAFENGYKGWRAGPPEGLEI